ncbi:response regulator [Synechococcus sp. PCC 7336]|uniref:response regulator n=1 Tax=Synechococcus sp. PCC 7336 TaxID=195250 RepID=UPI000347525D|nr:response regulator [Synechococcus sp. PCC 7336]
MVKVLLVEDDPLNARVFATILKKRGGFEVVQSQDVVEILEIVAGGEISAVLMDVSLSQSTYKGESVDGIRITQLLKQNPQSQSVPVILVTAHAMRGDRELFLRESGAEGYIAKPVVDQQALVQKVEQLARASIS